MKDETDSMPLLDHLSELRRRVLYILLFSLAAVVAGYFVYPLLVTQILHLTRHIPAPMQMLAIHEGFLTRMRYSLVLGLFFTAPFALVQICAFLFPGLTGRERNWLTLGLITGAFLFLLGMFYATQAILPFCLKLFQEEAFQPNGVVYSLHYSRTLDFLLHLLLAFGMVFELPLALFLLMGCGLLKRRTLLHGGRYAVVIAFILAAILTPPDPFSQILLAIPLIGLFYLAILLARFFRLGGD